MTIPSLAGAAKPAKKIISHALDQHRLDLQEVLHEGNHFFKDVEGARQTGLHAVLGK